MLIVSLIVSLFKVIQNKINTEPVLASGDVINANIMRMNLIQTHSLKKSIVTVCKLAVMEKKRHAVIGK